MDTGMAFGSFSGWESGEGPQCPGGRLPSLQWLLLPPCCPEILVLTRASLALRKNITAIGASLGFEGKTLSFLT